MARLSRGVKRRVRLPSSVKSYVRSVRLLRSENVWDKEGGAEVVQDHHEVGPEVGGIQPHRDQGGEGVHC